MPIRNTRDEWGSVSKLLHWAVLAMVLAMAYLGLTMGDLPNGPGKAATYALHKSIGLTLLAVMLLRLAWRLWAGAPAPVAGTPRWQAHVARLTHWGLYALLLAMPLSGWILNSAAGAPLQWFGLVSVPALGGQDEGLREIAEEAHELLFWTLVALALVHVAAAVYHHLFARDATLLRMLPGRLRKAR